MTIHRIAAAVAAIAILGCGGSGVTAPTPIAQGTYTLSTVNGAALPATIVSVPYGETQVTFSGIDLEGGGAYHDSTVLGTAIQVDDGTWSASGGTVTIHTAAWTVTASLTGLTLSVPFAGTPLGAYTYAYTRQ